jgi:mannose-1-phosphate guanylyltransferase
MSCGFLADRIRDVLGDGSALGLRLRFVEEPEPRGTAGALKLAEPLLDERFLMLNGDVLTDIDLTAQIAQHEATGAVATLALVPVADPSAYGLVLLEPDNSVREFIEKPNPEEPAPGNLISAGAYVLERSILELVDPGRAVSIEREVWPRLVGAGLYGFPSESYWLDIGTPARYLQATFDIIEANVATGVRDRLGDGWLAVADGARLEGRVVPPAVLEHGVRVAEGAHVGSLVVLGADVSVAAGSTVERAVIMRGSTVAEGCVLRDCIVGPDCAIGRKSRVSGGAVLGEGVRIGAENVITRGARLFPGVELPDGAIEF